MSYQLIEEHTHSLYFYNQKLDIVMVEFKPDSVISIEEANEIIETLERLFKVHTEFWGITKFGESSTVDAEARDFFSKASFTIEKTRAMAVISNSLAHRLIFNIYLKFNSPKIQHKAFSSIEKAEAWFNRLKVYKNGA